MADSTDSPSEFKSAKEQQKRDSIMNELYNDMSSSDEDEDEQEDSGPALIKEAENSKKEEVEGTGGAGTPSST